MRLKDYDYSNHGAYFVTICTQDRECLFGNIVQGEMIFNDAGSMVNKIWNELNDKYTRIETDEFIIMPNHVHGIIFIVGAGPRACPDADDPDYQRNDAGHPQGCAPTITRAESQGHPQGDDPALSLSDVVHRFKSYTTAQYRIGVELHNWQPFRGKLWQRNYYEHIIRNEEELTKIREYIRNNTIQWEMDKENPASVNNPERS